MKIHRLPTNIDLSKAILWQYENADKLRQIIQMLQDASELSSVDLWKKAFFAFDLDKQIVEGNEDYEFRIHGLYALSVLFGISRPTWDNNGQQETVSVNTWRLYLKGMIWLMDSDGSCEDINKWLSIIFPDSHSYVEDGLDMTITYNFFPEPKEGTEEYQMIRVDGFLPHPAGVTIRTPYTKDDGIFGFKNQNLGQLNNSRLSHKGESFN